MRVMQATSKTLSVSDAKARGARRQGAHIIEPHVGILQPRWPLVSSDPADVEAGNTIILGAGNARLALEQPSKHFLQLAELHVVGIRVIESEPLVGDEDGIGCRHRARLHQLVVCEELLVWPELGQLVKECGDRHHVHRIAHR
eukprot:1479844-Prymnesium_polylepis.1